MVSLEITAEITQSKLLEFNQSKLSFINKLQSIDGYSGFTEKHGKIFVIKLLWRNRKLLDNFMKSELYRFFHGAIITLSSKNSEEINNEISI